MMIAATSHDMRTPLNSILSMLDLLEPYLAQSEP